MEIRGGLIARGGAWLSGGRGFRRSADGASPDLSDWKFDRMAGKTDPELSAEDEERGTCRRRDHGGACGYTLCRDSGVFAVRVISPEFLVWCGS